MNAPLLTPRWENTDEIDLIDLWLIFKRRWHWVLAAMGICLAAALAWGLLQKPVATWQSSLQLGALILDGRVVSLEDPEAVQTAVTQRTALAGNPPVKVDINRGSDVITLSVTGSAAQAVAFKARLTDQTQTILDEQARLQAAYQAQLAPQAEAAVVLFRPARVLTPAAVASGDGPLGLPLLGAIGLFLGLMLGCGAILVAEFFAAVRQRELQQPGQTTAKRRPTVVAGTRRAAGAGSQIA